jgi:hypothetical protein
MPGRYCAGATTVVVVEVGGATGSPTVVVVRLTVVVVVVGGGVVTTSSLEQATRETPTTINGRRRHSVCISVRASFVPRITVSFYLLGVALLSLKGSMATVLGLSNP